MVSSKDAEDLIDAINSDIENVRKHIYQTF